VAKLIVSSGPAKGRKVRLVQSQIIGRLRSNDVCLPDDGLSRKHARITRHLDRWLVVDLNSKNGVLVNGSRVRRAELQDGDTLVLGHSELRVVFGPEDRAPPAAAPPRTAAARSSDPSDAIRYGRGGGTSPHRVILRPGRKEEPSGGRWWSLLHADAGQIGGLHRFLLIVGLVALVAGIGYLGFLLVAG